MPIGCLGKNCRECGYKVITGAKLRCNYNNRLGLASGEAIKQFIPTESEEEILARQLEARKKEIEQLEKRQKEIAEIREGEKGEPKGVTETG